MDYFSKAGGRSIESSAYAEAISHLTRGLEELGQLPANSHRSRLELDLRSRLGVALIASKGFSSGEGHENYTRAGQLCTELGDEVPIRVLYGTWAVNLVRGDLPATRNLVPSWQRLLDRSEDSAAHLIAHTTLGAWTFFRAEYAAAIAHNTAANALRDLERPRAQHLSMLEKHGFEGLMYPAIYLAWSQLVTGDIAGARRTSRQSIDLVRVIDDPYVTVGVLIFTAFLYHDLGDLEAAAELVAPAVTVCRSNGFAAWLMPATLVAGNGKLAQGAVDEAIAMMREALALGETLGALTPFAYYQSYLVEAYLAKGELDLAIEMLLQGLRAVRVNVEGYSEPELLRLLGEAYFARGDHEAARATLLSARALARSQGAALFELKAAATHARLLGSDREQTAGRLVQERLKSALKSDGTASPVNHVQPLLELLGS
jgi:tetratricopeptide (TPR) repeat protein